ncbi:MAG: tyrosine--tRNA ligase [Candidatus Nanoarchaeia archaeon]|nr:tyrosine--tRNA ligase [Candidatus Nanoarchaeia archaeon]MDD5239295.1 tyrosine--tRNA ligase [Candidatus Nanoarchaeia archaeon]
MDINEKLELIRKNTAEIISEDELRELLSKKKKPTVYCGYEPSGSMHLGNFVTITKLIDLQKAGFNVIVLLADVHGLLNRKGNVDEIAKNVIAWKKTIKAIGLDAKVVLGSSFEFDKDYQLEIMKMAQEVTINRGLRSMQEVARDVENATISQIWYPLMQIEDIKALGCDVSEAGIDQRKIHMLARELVHITNHKPVFVHTPMITSLKGPGTKMSKSIPGSGVNVTDTDEEIKKSINGAYCPEKAVEDNPLLQISKLIIFPRIRKLDIKRPEKFGGDISFKTYEELENVYVQGKLHPMDLKAAVASELIKIIKPIRDNFKK